MRLQGGDHLFPAGKPGAARISTELALTAEPQVIKSNSPML